MRADIEIFRDENIALQTEEKKLDHRFKEISGARTVEIRREERTLPEMVRFLEETDRATRETAWRAMWERREPDRESRNAERANSLGVDPLGPDG